MEEDPPSLGKTVVLSSTPLRDGSLLKTIPRSWGRVVLLCPHSQMGDKFCGYDDGVVRVKCIDIEKFHLPVLGALLVASLPVLSGRDTVVVVRDFREYLGGGGIRLSSRVVRRLYREFRDDFEKFSDVFRLRKFLAKKALL